MKVFLSWSGPRSKALASYLDKWIPDVIQHAEPWMSATDIDAGARWNRSIEEKLRETRFGILCLTKSNINSPWILFEAGALAKTIEDTFVCPYLIDLETSEVPRGPLTQFQAKRANEVETLELMRTMNKALKDGALSEERLRRIFDRCWPELATTIEKLPEELAVVEPPPSLEIMTKEVLDLVRGLSRRSSTDITIIGREPRTTSPPEMMLEEELTKRGIEYKTQYWIDRYKLDFYFDINEVRLDVEIDGIAYSSASKMIERDRIRTNFLVQNQATFLA